MTEDGSWGAQLSIKYGNGNMVNIRAKNVQELIAETGALADAGPFLVASTEEFQAHAAIQAAFTGATQVVSSAPIAPAAQPTQQAPSGGRTCAHGAPMSFREGNKNGKSWSGWFCQVKNDPRLAECPAQFNR